MISVRVVYGYGDCEDCGPWEDRRLYVNEILIHESDDHLGDGTGIPITDMAEFVGGLEVVCKVAGVPFELKEIEE